MDVAIVGLGCRFPQAPDPVSYWDLIRAGTVTFRQIPASRWNHARIFLDDSLRTPDKAYIGRGGGWVGIHSAADTEYDWPFYGGLLGAYFKQHPAVQPAAIDVTDRAHPSTRHLPARWTRTDEWYDFRSNPRGSVHVLATLDESTYSGGTMGADHPIAWCHPFRGGRAWYTAGGHTVESYSEPDFRRHVLGGILWAAGLAKGGCPI